MKQLSAEGNSNSLDNPAVSSSSEFEIHPHSHLPTLNEVQLRACRIHYEHGGVCGGYTLDDWLEAEHQLTDEDQPSGKKEHVH
jgi:hypothetical protein